MKLYGYFLKRTDSVRAVDWPPIASPKLLEDAESVEILDFPGKDGWVFLYVIWPDNFRYLQGWNEQAIKELMPAKFKGVFKTKKRKVWSKKLERKLLKDARPN